MAAQWLENYKSYGNNVSYMSDGLYAQATLRLLEDPDPNETGYVAKISDGFDILRKVLSGNKTTVGVAQRYWFPTLPVSDNIPYILRFCDEDNVIQTSLAVTSTGKLQVYRGGGVALLAESTGPVVVTNAWTHIEMKVLFSQTVGTVEVRVNGVTVISATGLDTVQSAKVHCAQVSLDCDNASDGVPRISMYCKDYFIWDGEGTHNNNFAGTVSIIDLIEESDIDLGDWAPSTGSTGFDLVNESPPDDAKYISALTATTDPAVMTLSDLPEDVTSVRCLMTLVRSRKVDGGDGNLQVGLVSGSDVDLGADHPLTTAFTYYYDISEEDPATDAPWSPSAVNDADIQFDRTI